MAADYYGEGELRITKHGHALWAAENGIDYPLGWSIFEAETNLEQILAAKAKRQQGIGRNQSRETAE